jgi:tRNA A-37 threonylcarbamoyl transferase component Bud32
MLAPDAPEGLCPECLLQQGFAEVGRWAPGQPLHSSPRTHPFIPPEPSALAEDFPQLEILQLLGQGGMGAVYKARQRKLDRLVALKILPPEAGRDPAFAERFAREARALARLSHPNVVGIHDFGEVRGLYFFIMEFVDGVNLRQLLEAGNLTSDEALRIIPQVCDALQYAHEEEIIHRDIKPENIMLTRRGRVKIADFGLAKLLSATPSGFSLTGSQQVMGTPFYMAPEQMQKARAVDHRADIYSLGVVFYEMLTGELPLGRFAPPSAKAPVDQRLDEVVFRALEKEPEQRYQHISDVKNAVDSILAGNAAPAAAAPAPVGVRRQEGPRLRVAVPHWSGGKGYGILRLAADALTLEFDAGVVVGWFSERYKEVRIPLAEIESVHLDRGKKSFWGRWLKIRTYKLSSLAGVPGCRSGESKFFILREDRQAAERFVDRVNRRLLGAAAPAPAPLFEEQPERFLDRLRRRLAPAAAALDLEPQHDPPLDELRRQVSRPAWGLIITGIAATLFWYSMLLAVHEPPSAVLFVLGLPVSVVVVFGGICLKGLAGFRYVQVGAILAMLPWSPAVLLGLPMGIWTLLLLRRPEIRAALRRPQPAAKPLPPPEKPPARPNVIVRKVKSLFGSMHSLFLGSRIDKRPDQPDRATPTEDYQHEQPAEPPVNN